MPYDTSQQGSAVILFLIAIAVAILAGVATLYYMGTHTPQPIARPSSVDSVEEKQNTTTTSKKEISPAIEQWRTYEHEVYQFAFMYPQGWAVREDEVLGVPVITAYDASQIIGTSTDIHNLPLRLSVYPQGFPVGGSGEEEFQSTVIVPVPEAVAKDYRLGTGRPWATVVRFEKWPSAWNSAGFVYARIPIEEEEVAYMRGDIGISPEEYDVYSGDRIVRYGFVDTQKRELIEHMLRSFSMHFDASTQSKHDSTTYRVRITAPVAYATVTSPLEVRGEIFDTQKQPLSLRVVVGTGTVLTSLPVVSENTTGDNGTTTFSMSIILPETTATSGVIELFTTDSQDIRSYVPVVLGG